MESSWKKKSIQYLKCLLDSYQIVENFSREQKDHHQLNKKIERMTLEEILWPPKKVERNLGTVQQNHIPHAQNPSHPFMLIKVNT